ncbi:hypothetical protein [Lactococcus fujiensis]|uniref:Uncharacterized protein n=1 Tax=Lactococcus fujiensis JCM 16395 TaxID=1291764 RepID=A0A2A5RI43_9LACT|nr:hypothetical protein [Lactococcus fujiensis]PCR98743.1 hypothetical protein RT41_GL000923 [Lactococcus fujiensis JCM 16395]
MARKTLKQIEEDEKKMLNDLSKNKTDNIDTTEKRELFKNIENKVQKKNTSYDEIKKHFEKTGIGKQGSFYLNEDLMKLFRKKTFEEGISIAEVVRKLLVQDYFTEDELREIYIKEELN